MATAVDRALGEVIRVQHSPAGAEVAQGDAVGMHMCEPTESTQGADSHARGEQQRAHHDAEASRAVATAV